MTIKRCVIRLDLLDEVVLSERSATAGGHRSLDYLPGAVLLGAVAAALYDRFDKKGLAFTAFHSGKVRFGNGLPLEADGTPSWPMPLSLHRRKGVESADSSLQGQGAVNLVIGIDAHPRDQFQMEQIRRGYVTADLRVRTPPMTFAMKTGIDPWRGRARDQQLFGYEALESGQSFVAMIEADADCGVALSEIIEFLSKSRKLRIGRSRSAEFGRVGVELLGEDAIEPPSLAGKEGQMVLWALSDLCLVDKTGQPLLTLDGSAFGFLEARIDWTRTHLRTRRYAPFNGHWGHPGLERVVISQGSVITLKERGVGDADARERLVSGIGQFREAGLGRLAINPWIVSPDGPEPAVVKRVRMPTTDSPVEGQKTNLIFWLQQKQARASSVESRSSFVECKLKELGKRYRQAARWSKGEAGAIVGPEAAQWNAVRDAAEQLARNPKGLHDRLFDVKVGIARASDDIWGTRFGVDEGARAATFNGWLTALVDELSKRDDGLARLLPEIAKYAAEATRRRSKA